MLITSKPAPNTPFLCILKRKKKEIRGDRHSQEGIKTELKLLRYLNAHLKNVVVDKGSFEKKKNRYSLYIVRHFFL